MCVSLSVCVCVCCPPHWPDTLCYKVWTEICSIVTSFNSKNNSWPNLKFTDPNFSHISFSHSCISWYFSDSFYPSWASHWKWFQGLCWTLEGNIFFTTNCSSWVLVSWESMATLFCSNFHQQIRNWQEFLLLLTLRLKKSTRLLDSLPSQVA